MVWSPVIERELRVAARRSSTYRVRLLALFAVGAVFAWMILVGQKSTLTSENDGQRLFSLLAIPAAIFSILIGVFATSDSISFEKREGTLGLLFLTDLKGYDVVWGKLVASSLNGFYAVIAVLPILGLPILAGGVSMGQFARLALALLSAVVFSLTVGIFVSSYTRDERQSAFYTFILLGISSVFPLGPGFVIAEASWAPVGWAIGYWLSIVMIWLAILTALVIASQRVPRSWQEKAPAPEIEETIALVPQRKRPHQPIFIHPFTWLALRGEPKCQLVWLFVLSIGVLWMIPWLSEIFGSGPSVMTDLEVLMPTISIINTFLKVWIAAEASRRFVEDRRNNAFELLLSTPLDEGQILRGQWLALVQQFGRPLLALVLAESFLGLCLARRDDFASGWTLMAAIFLAFDSIALGWAGIWSGMVCKSRIRAILLSTTVVLAAPWGLSYLWTSMAVDYDVSTNAYGVLHQSFIRNMAFHKFIIGLVVDLIVIILASIYLERNFRRFVTERPARQAD